MDEPALSSNDSTSVTGGGPTQSAVPADEESDSAVINADKLLDTMADAATPMVDPNAPTGKIGDPLADVDVDDSADAADPALLSQDDDIVPNETITTNDWSKVGEVKPPTPPDDPEEDLPILPFAPPAPSPVIKAEPKSAAPLPAPPPILTLTPDPIVKPLHPIEPEEPKEPDQSDQLPELETPPFGSELKFKLPGAEDPDKIAFVKTYTEEFDKALRRATDAAQSILDAIDTAIREHSPDITVPDQVNEFLTKHPTDGKVARFEDARDIVNEVLDRAADAKVAKSQAATEAAKIYDEVQAFKKATEAKIAALVSDQPPEVSGEPDWSDAAA